jgi:LysM repeat protein
VQKGDITDKEKVNTENKAENKEAIGSRLKKHTIVAGETLYGIAKAYNVSLGDILKWNNKDDYSIKEGEIIIVQAK